MARNDMRARKTRDAAFTVTSSKSARGSRERPMKMKNAPDRAGARRNRSRSMGPEGPQTIGPAMTDRCRSDGTYSVGPDSKL
jgi:hypothetical protein